MKVRAKKTFYDKVEEKMREAGDIFEVSSKRFTEINGTRFGELAEVVEVPKPITPEDKKKKPSRR